MEKGKIKKYMVCMLFSLMACGLVCSCSNEDGLGKVNPEPDDKDKIDLSIAIDSFVEEPDTRASGNHSGTDGAFEKAIYSIDIFVFKPDGKIDNKGIYQTVRPTGAIGTQEDLPRITSKEVKNIEVTAGARNIYVIANNADKNYGKTVALTKDNFTLADLKKHLADLKTQQLFNCQPEKSGEVIGGHSPHLKYSRLTMVYALEDAILENTSTHHYLGYTPISIPPGGEAVKNSSKQKITSPILLERLVARVAITKITLPTGVLELEAGKTFNANEYVAALDGISLINVKTTSQLHSDFKLPLANTAKYGFGETKSYTHFSTNYPTGRFPTPTGTNNWFHINKTASSKIDEVVNDAYGFKYPYKLSEPLSFQGGYDISATKNHVPLWFYVFENHKGTGSNPDIPDFPTIFVVGVKYNYQSKTAPFGNKTVTHYYPLVVNYNGTPKTPGLGDSHKYIKRNFQYSLTLNVTGLSKYVNGILPGPLTRAALNGEFDGEGLEVETVYGENLFPWTGNVYY